MSMARLLAAISTGVALLVGGLTALAVMLPPEYGYLVPIVIILVVGVSTQRGSRRLPALLR